MSNRTQLRWGVLGCAGIAIRSVIPGIRESEFGYVTAIASRELSKAQETAAKLDIPTAYGSYEELLADPDIEAVYIPLPNHLHKEWTVRAAEAGKHVLCEKPIALTAAEAAEMEAACCKAGVHFEEAFMYRHHPRYAMIKEVIASGEIGQVRGIHGTFTFNCAANAGIVNFRRDWGGGSLYDIGCYPISAARMLLGAEPEAATVQAFFSPEHDHVDMMATGLVEFPDSIGLTFDCAMWAAFRNTLEVLGIDGRIEVPGAFVYPKEEGGGNFFVIVKDERREVQVPEVNQYALQVDNFARVVLQGAAPLMAKDDMVAGMRVLDACLESARTRSRVTIANG